MTKTSTCIDQKGITHLIDPCNSEHTLCSLVWEGTCDDSDDDKSAWTETQFPVPINCEDCKRIYKAHKAMRATLMN